MDEQSRVLMEAELLHIPEGEQRDRMRRHMEATRPIIDRYFDGLKAIRAARRASEARRRA